MSPKSLSPRAARRGFTLVEVMLVVVIIGFLTLLAMPLLTKSRDNARAARFINDLRNGVHAFETFALMTGTYPAGTAAGVIPDDMQDELKRPQWDKATPIGGSWKWSTPESEDYYVGIVIVGPTVPVSLLRTIDQRIDDGDLTTGVFKGDSSEVVYIVE